MKNLMIGAAALALLTGCNGGDKPSTPEQTLSELVVRDGDPAKAGDALTAMALGGDAAGVLTFADSSTDGDDATFTDLGVAGVDELKIGGLTLEGLDMAGDTAIFGKMSIDDIAITAPEGESGEVMIGNIELINPSPELAAWMAATLNGQEVPFPAVENVSFRSVATNYDRNRPLPFPPTGNSGPDFRSILPDHLGVMTDGLKVAVSLVIEDPRCPELSELVNFIVFPFPVERRY